MHLSLHYSALPHFVIIMYVVLCRVSIAFLSFDVVIVLICVAVACLIGIAVCCCLPCILALLYAVTDQVNMFFFLILDLVYRLCLGNKFLMPGHFQNGKNDFSE